MGVIPNWDNKFVFPPILGIGIEDEVPEPLVSRDDVEPWKKKRKEK